MGVTDPIAIGLAESLARLRVYPDRMRHNLEQRIESMGMKGKIFDVVVPTEEEIEVKDGKSGNSMGVFRAQEVPQ